MERDRGADEGERIKNEEEEEWCEEREQGREAARGEGSDHL